MLWMEELYDACCEGVDAGLHGDLFLKQPKSALLAAMTTLMSKHFLTPNVWTLRMVYKSFKSIEKGGTSEGVLAWWNVLMQICSRAGPGAAEDVLQRFLGGLVGGVEGMKAAVEHVAFVSTVDFEDVAAYKNVVTERVYAYLNYIYKSVLTTENPALCLQVVIYLCTLPAKEVFAGGGGGASVSIEDVVWKLLSYVAATCGKEDIKDFYLIARELYYYKLKTKDRGARRNYLLFAVMALAKKDVRNKAVMGVRLPSAPVADTPTKSGGSKASAKKGEGAEADMGAWFMKPLMQDDALIAAVARECEARRQYHVGKEKSVQVDELPSVAYRSMVEIIKIR